jgi:hypothetical protein
MCAPILAALLAAVPALPPGVLVSPVLVELSMARPFADLTVRNVGPAPREIRAHVLSWSQDESGRVVLAPAAGIAMFPARAVLAPGEARRFRVSSEEGAAEQERAYRVALSVRDLDAGGAVTALVPAFFAPARARTAAAVRIACTPTACRVVVVNDGTVRFRPDHVSVALIEDGGDRSERALEGWWVLAGGARAYEIPLTPGSAPRELVARVDLGGEAVIARTNVDP